MAGIFRHLFKSLAKLSVSYPLVDTSFMPPIMDMDTIEEPCIPFPERSPDALAGSAFGASIINTTASPTRDSLFLTQIKGGNVPTHCRATTTITVESGDNKLEYQVSGDYLSVGSDTDYLRVSVTAQIGKQIADYYRCILPTPKIVDQIWAAADLKLAPHPMGASAQMMSTKVLVAHNQAINTQIDGRDFHLVAGTKKDTVIDKILLTRKGNVGIYGWQLLPSGTPIQQLNCSSHDIKYQDYSSGIRLVCRDAYLNDQPVDLLDVLNNPSLSSLISEEGAYDASSIYI